MAHVIAGNLAVAHGGRILQVEGVTDAELDLLKDEFRTWSNGAPNERQQAKDAILGFIRARLPKALCTSSSKSPVSFITRGIPYGVLPFDRPTTHYFSFPRLGLNVVSGMLKCLDHVRCPVVILIDPNRVGQSEFGTLRKTFGVAGYHLRLAYGDRATIMDATYPTRWPMRTSGTSTGRSTR
jgi:hypothetical protein